MNIILATSRGRGLGPLIQRNLPNTKVVVRPGQKYAALANEARQIISSMKEDPSDIHIYFLAGYTDLTSMVKKGSYQEVIFTESPQVATNRVMGEVENAADLVLATGAKVCFATIIPGNIETWNRTRLQQKRTITLRHTHKYATWQENLNEAVIAINKAIVETNIKNNMQTPRTHQPLISIRKKGKYRFHFNRLAKDGIHTTQKAKEEIVKELSKAILKNMDGKTQNSTKEISSDSEPESPKRAWKTY